MPDYFAFVDLLHHGNMYFSLYYNYPPLWGYIFFPFVWLASLFGGASNLGQLAIAQVMPVALRTNMVAFLITSPLFNLALKTPLILFDLGTAYLLMTFTEDKIKRRNIFALWFLCPLVIFESSVHGAFDVIPVFFSILGMATLVRKQYFFAGMSILLSIMLKLYPAYLTLFYITVIVLLEAGAQGVFRKLIAIGKSLALFLGGLAFTAAVLFVLLPSFTGTNILSSSFYSISSTVVGYVSPVGGLNVWSLKWLPGLGYFDSWVISHSYVLTVPRFVGIPLLAVLLGVLLRKRLAQGDIVRPVLIGSTAVMIATYFTIPVVQPQYIIWLLPYLVLGSLLYGWYKIRFHLVWFFAVALELAIQGPFTFLYPLALYTPFLSSQVITIGTLNYFSTAGLVNNYLYLDLYWILGFLGFLSYVSCLFMRRIPWKPKRIKVRFTLFASTCKQKFLQRKARASCAKRFFLKKAQDE
jgi:hypothetical protein